jgi:hypothetical protein
MYYRIEWTCYCVGTPDMAPTLGRYNSSRRAGVVTHADLRENYNPGNKYSQWELKGMCVRLELGPKDMQKESVMSVRRDSGAKEAIPWNELTKRMPEILEEMQEAMYKRAKEKVSASMATVSFPSLIFVFAGRELLEGMQQSLAFLLHNELGSHLQHPCVCNRQIRPQGPQCNEIQSTDDTGKEVADRIG